MLVAKSYAKILKSTSLQQYFFNMCCGLQKEELKIIVKRGRTGTDLRL